MSIIFGQPINTLYLCLCAKACVLTASRRAIYYECAPRFLVWTCTLCTEWSTSSIDCERESSLFDCFYTYRCGTRSASDLADVDEATLEVHAQVVAVADELDRDIDFTDTQRHPRLLFCKGRPFDSVGRFAMRLCDCKWVCVCVFFCLCVQI